MTGRIALTLLLALAAALAGTLVWQLQAVDDAPPPLPAATTPPPAPPAAATPDRPADTAATLLDRPLFSPDRRPPPPGAGPAAAPDAPLPRLTGTLVTPQGRSAIFAGGPQPVVVREGGILGRFSVQRIEPGRVTLSGPNGLQVIGTAFDPAAPRPRAPAPPAPLPGTPPIPGTSPGPADAPQDAMPFESNPAPSGMDIIREQARRQPPTPGRTP